jgi:hypothetical protein
MGMLVDGPPVHRTTSGVSGKEVGFAARTFGSSASLYPEESL